MLNGKTKFSIRKIGGGKRLHPAIIQMFKYAGLLAVTIVLMAIVYLHQQTGEWFKASVLEPHQPFNGTVFPVSRIPNWTHWSGNANTHYSQIIPSELLNMPNYDLAKMQFPNESLVWGNTDHDVIRNTKITYPVVYLGNYELDHQENSGSHLAIDIKMPIGTPIHAIANGKVVKTSLQTSGFGHHIVIKHIGVPDPDTGEKTTLYSCYVHMDEIDVSEGQNVLKGDLIGTSGNTGTSTTPHLHFQIDKDSAPWHPYWPFTSTESQSAGFSFFEAVNAGLGVSNARNNTINPINYVTKYIGAYSLASNDSGGIIPDTTNGNNSDDNQNQTTSDDTQDTGEDKENSVLDEDPEVEIIENPSNSDSGNDTSLFTFALSGEGVSLINNGVTILARDITGQIKSLNEDDEIRAEISGVGRLIKKTFRRLDFVNGTLKITVNSSEAGVSNVMIGKSSHKVTFVEKVNGIASFEVVHDGYFQTNVMETIKVNALDADGNLTPAVNFSGVVNVVLKTGSATVIPEQLSARDFKNGTATVRIKVPNESGVIVRAQNGALVGESSEMTAEDKYLFTDIGRGHKNYTAIKYLKDIGIIDGYSDGTFKPDKMVNRAEALKMLMLAFNVPSGPNGELPFSDTDSGAWYAASLGAALNRGIVKGYSDGTFKPAKTVNKAEYLKILFETNDIEVTDSLTSNPYADVPKDSWYAPYAYLTNRKNILDVSDNRLMPARGMTRGDVAETVYRLKYILDNNLVTYK